MLEIVPITQGEAFRFVHLVHRHLDPPEGWICGVGLERDGELVGAGILGRPVAPKTAKDRFVAEITRTAILEGVRNGNSKVYAALRDSAKSLGYRKVQTFTLPHESGASLRAVGFVLVRPWQDDEPRRPGQWGRSRAGRTFNLFGEPEAATQPKNRWECLLRGAPDRDQPRAMRD